LNINIAEPTNNHWKKIYCISGITTIVMMALFLFDVISWSFYRPYPDSGKAWIELLQNNHLKGILLLSIPTFIGTILYLFSFLSLNNILQKVNVALAQLATLFAIIGSIFLLSSHIAYPILYINNQYENTTHESQRISAINAIDERLISSGIGLNLGGFFVEGALVLFSILMIRSSEFGKVTAILGIIGHGLDFIRIGMNLMLIPEGISAILLIIGCVPQLIWIILVGIRLIQFGMKKENS
jgi:hypothetical protein